MSLVCHNYVYSYHSVGNSSLDLGLTSAVIFVRLMTPVDVGSPSMLLSWLLILLFTSDDMPISALKTNKAVMKVGSMRYSNDQVWSSLVAKHWSSYDTVVEMSSMLSSQISHLTSTPTHSAVQDMYVSRKWSHCSSQETDEDDIRMTCSATCIHSNAVIPCLAIFD